MFDGVLSYDGVTDTLTVDPSIMTTQFLTIGTTIMSAVVSLGLTFTVIYWAIRKLRGGGARA